MGFFDRWAGFGVTFATMRRKPFTQGYPEGWGGKRPKEKVTAPRYHGRHQLNRWPDGLEKCVGCELCAWACPADAIYVEGGRTPRKNGIPRVNGTGGCTKSTTCAAFSAECVSRPARLGR